MSEVWAPTDAAGTAEAVKEALQAGKTLELVGTATRRSLGRPVKADVVLDLSALRGVVLYEPRELILVVAPATPMVEIRQVLAEHKQHLAFEPPDYGRLWGRAAGEGTIGGAIMTGRNGPRRLTAGAARDQVLGVKGVNGFGKAFVAGGRVVKNVTGFDLPKLLTGSFGTLCAATELTLKTLPTPPNAATLVVFGLDDDKAMSAMRRAMNETSVPVSSAAHLPGDVSGSSAVEAIARRDAPATLMRIEGFGPSVESGVLELTEILGELGPCVVLDPEATREVWAEVADAAFFAGCDLPVWRLSVPPALGAAIGTRLTRELAARCFYDWAGGAVWLEAPEAADAHATVVRHALAELAGGDGHATLIRARAEVRASASPFQPLAPAVAVLNDRVRRQFDPAGILNPGRMHAVAHADAI